MGERTGRLSLREAAAAFEVSRPTLTKALAAGKLSGERDDRGGWRLDPSELARVYRPRSAPQAALETEGGEAARSELEALRARLAEREAALEIERTRREAAERLAEERAAHLADLRRLLPAPKPEGQAEPARRGWRRWFTLG